MNVRTPAASRLLRCLARPNSQEKQNLVRTFKNNTQGRCDEKFGEVRSLLQHNVETGEELGASVCVNLDGDDVVDIWGGYTDQTRQQLWQSDTITNVWSVTKNITSLAALVLVDRGLLDVEENVCHYWPEFAANGKKDIKVKHIMSHTSGLAGWEETVSIEDICDFQKAAGLLAKQKPWWTPGTASGYHSLTMGHLMGEIIFRITDKTLKRFVAEELASPLKADFQIGVKENDWKRISDVIPPPSFKQSVPAGNTLQWKTNFNPVFNADVANTALWRNADLGASNGHGNARSIVRMLCPITLGGTVPKRTEPLLSPKTIDLIFKEQSNGRDLVLESPMRFGIGFGLLLEDAFGENTPQSRVCYWAGWGGAFGIMDLDKRLTIAYAMNKMDSSHDMGERAYSYIDAVYKQL